MAFLQRSLPSRRMHVRMAGLRSAAKLTSSEHRSFRLTKPAKMGLVKKAFEGYVPGKFQRSLRRIKPSGTTDKEQAFFRRQLGAERALANKGEIKKFATGFLKEAHEEDVHLREGYNPAGHGHEVQEAKRLLKEFQHDNEKSDGPPTVDQRAEHLAHRQSMDAIRSRLGIQHDRMSGTPPPLLEPTPLGSTPPLGHGWTAEQPPAAAAPTSPSSTPSLNRATSTFTGGRISQLSGEPRDTVVQSGSTSAVPPSPQTVIGPTPTPEPPAPNPEVDLPDPKNVQDLPI